MDDRLKQRLIGAIVLVALAVIFIPMILDGGREKTLPSYGQAIPEKPAVLKKLEVATPKPIEVPPQPVMQERQLVDKYSAEIKPDTSVANKQTTSPVAKTEASRETESKTKVASSNKTTKAWVVQVGSFESKKNALALRKKLRKYKYQAFVEAVKSNASWNYRVRIGPEVRRSSAEETQKSLLRKLKINGVVMGHP